MEGQQAAAGEGGGAGQTGASGAGAGGESAGMFASLALKLPAEGGGEGAQDGAGSGEGGTQTVQADSGKQGEASGSQTNPPKMYAGKFKTVEEFEKAYESSGQEAFRLFLKNKEFSESSEKSALRVKELEGEIERLKSSPPSTFKELPPEQVKELKEQNPSSYADYLVEKRFNDENAKRENETRERTKKETEVQGKERQSKIFARIRDMEADIQGYPDFKTLQPIMDELIDMTDGRIAGQLWSPEVAYLAAFGVRALQAQKKAGSDKRKAEDEAKRKAGADSRGSGSAGAGAEGGAPKTPADDSDEALNERIIKAGPKSLLGW